MSDAVKALFGTLGGPLLVLVGLYFMNLSLRIMGIDAEPVFALVIALTPLWLPFVLFYLFYDNWMDFVRLQFAVENGRTTLRIKLPQEVFKSPEAMETVFNQIHNLNGPDNLWQAYIDGKVPLMFSFELVSIGGDVRFYANVPTKKIKNLLEAQLYAQYPGIEIVEETLDYTAEIDKIGEDFGCMSFHLVKKEDQEFPIKTYIDFGLDKMPKEEEKVEPMAPMLEALGAASPNERLWIQFLVKPHGKKNFNNGHLSASPTWEKKVFAKIDQLLGREGGSKLGPAELEQQPRLTTGERDTITAMERNAGKYAYDTAVRWMYIAREGHFNGDTIGLINRSFSNYDILNRNGIGIRWRTDFDYNWFSDFSGKRKLKMKNDELKQYKLRKYSNGGRSVDKTKIMTSEELATVWHIPGRSVVTPGLARIPSSRSEAPANLPINAT
ncbi:MAG: hypothetical protein AAGA35_00270 [Patescibacteria group bacterium]